MTGEINEIDKRGEEYLTLLGFGEIIDQLVTVGDKTVPAKDFLQFCGKHAIPAFEAFKTLDPNSSDYAITRDALTNMVTSFVKPSETKQ